MTGRGAMDLGGRATGALGPGAAVHMPPGLKHSGRALPSPGGEPFRMAYFALLAGDGGDSGSGGAALS